MLTIALHRIEFDGRHGATAVERRSTRRRMQLELRKLNPPSCPGHPAYAAVRLVRGAD